MVYEEPLMPQGQSPRSGCGSDLPRELGPLRKLNVGLPLQGDLGFVVYRVSGLGFRVWGGSP